MSAKRLRVAWFAELDQVGDEISYSAYFSSVILPLLQDRVDINLFSSKSGDFDGYNVEHFLKAYQIHCHRPFDIFFYQLEDRPSCQWLRIAACLFPGITYFHDFLFTTFGPEPILNSPWQGMINAFNSDKEYWPALLDEQEQLGPFAFREAAFAGVKIFSQPTALREAKRQIKTQVDIGQSKSFYYLPLPAMNVTASLDQYSMTLSIDLSAKETKRLQVQKLKQVPRILFCGSPWMQHRSHKLLEAINYYNPSLSLVWLVSASEINAAEQMCKRAGLSNFELVVGRTPQKWLNIVQSGGLAIHTLFSVYGQTGPYLPISMAAGLPIIVTRFADSEYLPEHLIFQVQSGEYEVSELIKVFELVFEKQVLPDIALLQEFAVENYSPQQLAAELLYIFRQSSHAIELLTKRWQEFQQRAAKKLVAQSLSLLPDTDKMTGEELKIFDKVYQEFGWV